MFNLLTRALTSNRFIPRLLLILLPLAGILTGVGVYEMNKDKSEKSVPDILSLARNDPGHYIFIAGLIVIAILQACIFLLSWQSLQTRIYESHGCPDDINEEVDEVGEGRHVMNSLTFGFSLATLPLLVITAFSSSSSSSYIFIIAGGMWLLAIATSQVLLLVTRFIILIKEHGTGHSSLWPRFYFAFCFIGAVVIALIWLIKYSDDNSLQYVFLLLNMFFYLGLWPEFSDIKSLRASLTSNAVTYEQIY